VTPQAFDRACRALPADRLAQSHRLVAAKLTRKARRELGLE